MSGSKKHPLEIYRESGGQLGKTQRIIDDGEDLDGPDAPDAPDEPETPDAPVVAAPAPPPPREYERPVAAERPLSEFELRLNLNGTLILVFSLVVLLVASHIYGYQRGRGAADDQQNQRALALGERLENGTAPGASGNSSDPATVSDLPWGVATVTYASNRVSLVNDLIDTLRTDYGITGVYAWDTQNGKIEVFVGKFARRDDTELIDLRRTLRLISDYPSGNPAPFTRAEIKQHPRMPPD